MLVRPPAPWEPHNRGPSPEITHQLKNMLPNEQATSLFPRCDGQLAPS